MDYLVPSNGCMPFRVKKSIGALDSVLYAHGQTDRHKCTMH